MNNDIKDTLFKRKSFIEIKDKIDAIWKKGDEDFIVKEISERYGLLDFNKKYVFKRDSKGEHLICVIIKKNIETFKMIKNISKILHISPKRINLAGIKDKRAYTIQLGSIYKIKKEKVEKIRHLLKNIDVLPIEYSNKKIHLGELKGNHFTITLRKISSENEKKIRESLNMFLEVYDGYFPNYYGIQRIGDIKKPTPLLGYYLLKRDWENFIKTYLGGKLKDIEENKMGYYEKKIYLYLKGHNEKDYLGAIKIIPPSLLRILVNAYQSYIFNLVLNKVISQTKDWKELKSLNITIPGSDYEIFAINNQYSKEIEEILNKNGISSKAFKFPEFGFESKGLVRNALSKVSDLKFYFKDDDLFPPYKKLILDFSLPKGSYASTFLEEFFNLKGTPYQHTFSKC